MASPSNPRCLLYASLALHCIILYVQCAFNICVPIRAVLHYPPQSPVPFTSLDFPTYILSKFHVSNSAVYSLHATEIPPLSPYIVYTTPRCVQYVFTLLCSMSLHDCAVCLYIIVQYVFTLLCSMSLHCCAVCLYIIVQYVFTLL